MGVELSDNLMAQALSVQQSPMPGNGALRWGYDYRSPLLPPPGSRERERYLRQYWHNPHNTMFKGAASGLIKRIQSTPWEVSAKDATRWQNLLMNADFGDWDRFVAKVVKDFLRHDAGAWIELIAPGDVRYAPTGPVVGIAALDSLRVYPTGNPEFPCIYYDIHGKMHMMHRSRVIQFVDSDDSEETLAGYGESALSRAIAPVRREILINRFTEAFLDDKPMPGVMVFKNLGPAEVEQAFAQFEKEDATDNGSDWGRVVKLFGLDAETAPEIQFYSNSKAPEGFDLEKYKTLIAREEANALGLDIQDFWELSGQGIGTASQSEILAQKSRGKAFGRILKGLERRINRMLPEGAEFAWKYKDAQEDKETAEKAQLWVTTAQTASTVITPDEQRQVIANQVEAFADVLLDENGQLVRLPDDDPKAEGQSVNPDATLTDTDVRTQLVENLTEPQSQPSIAETLVQNLTLRAFTGTSQDFTKYFDSFVRVGQAQSFPPAIMRATFREGLLRAGTKAYEDGMRDGGADPSEADATEMADRRRTIADWLAVQNPYINSFVDDVNSGAVTPEMAQQRAQLWVNKSLRAIYLSGLHDADKQGRYMWAIGPTEEHCPDCVMLNGQVHSLKEWMASGYYPGANTLACEGFECGCRMVKTSLPVRGRLPNAPAGNTLFDNLSAFLGRIARRAVSEPVRVFDMWDRWALHYIGVA